MATTTSSTVLSSVPPTLTPHHFFPLPKQISNLNRWSSFRGQTKSSFNLMPLVLRSSSSSSSAPVVTEQGTEEGTGSPSRLVQTESPPTEPSDSLPPLRGCKSCGREEIEKGCNGEGRIQGGIATVPGFGWWPIKAYRPCPGFVAAGGRYRRRGQSMDEVASGRGKSRASVGIDNEA